MLGLFLTGFASTGLLHMDNMSSEGVPAQGVSALPPAACAAE